VPIRAREERSAVAHDGRDNEGKSCIIEKVELVYGELRGGRWAMPRGDNIDLSGQDEVRLLSKCC
jgi:hypothetical protein